MDCYVMSFLFGGTPPTTRELAARYKMQINRSIRELERESMRLQNEEKICMQEVKCCSKNNMKQSFQKACAVVRTRRMLNKFSQMKAHLQGISMRIQSVKTMEALQKAVASAARMMQSFNRVSGGTELVNCLKELEKQNVFMTVQSDMIDEQLDEVFEEDNNEDAPEDLVMQVMTEAGVELPNAHSDLLSLEERFERLKPKPQVIK